MVQPDLLQCIPINIEIEYFMWYKNFLCLVQYFIPLILISGAYIRYLSTIIKELFNVSSTTSIEVEIILFKIPKSCDTFFYDPNKNENLQYKLIICKNKGKTKFS